MGPSPISTTNTCHYLPALIPSIALGTRNFEAMFGLATMDEVSRPCFVAMDCSSDLAMTMAMDVSVEDATPGRFPSPLPLGRHIM